MALWGCCLHLLLLVLLRTHSQPGETPNPSLCQKTRLYVSCRDRGLSGFPQDLDSGVQWIDASHNAIANLTAGDTSGLTQVVHLDLSSNRLQLISEGALTPLVHLRSFILASNHLHQNHFSNGGALLLLRHLRTLDLSANHLESDMAAFYLRSLPSLQQLDLSQNLITQLSAGFFRGVPRLREINLEGNHIAEIEEGAFAALRKLLVLNLAANSLPCLSTFSLTQLRVLNLSHNALLWFSVADGGSGETYVLQTLDLSHNQLEFLPLLPGRSSVRQLNLSHNAIAHLMGNPAGTEAFKRWSRLRDLDLSDNRLGSFPLQFLRSLSSLHTLRLANNCLRDGVMELARDCRLLHLGGTSTKSGARRRVSLLSLRWLELRGNDIRYLPPCFFEILPNLEGMDLSLNSLHLCGSSSRYKEVPPVAGRKNCTAFHHLRHLRHLSLAGNNLLALPSDLFRRSALSSLDVSENKGLIIPEGTLEGLESSLERLSLRGNQMVSSGVTLPCLRGLKAMDLSDNKLSHLPPGLTCSSLEQLDIGKNRFQHLEDATARGLAGSLQELSLAGNPFNCCELQWLETMEASSVRILDLDKARCSYRDTNKSLSAPILDGDTWCPHFHRSHNAGVVVVLVVLFCLLLLTSAVYFSLRMLRLCIVDPVRSPSSVTPQNSEQRSMPPSLV